VKLIRLELESAKNILIFPGIRSSTPNYGIDGSVLVDFSNVKIQVLSFRNGLVKIWSRDDTGSSDPFLPASWANMRVAEKAVAGTTP
jgi:hypothetical protein